MYETNDDTMASIVATLLVEVGFLVPIVAISKLIIVMHLLGIQLQWEPLVAMALVTIPVYFGDRLFVDEEDKDNEQKSLRNNLLERFQTHLVTLVILSFIGFEILTFTHLSHIGFLAVQFPFLIFVSYLLLKKIRHIDTVGIATAWSVELILLATLFSSYPLTIEPRLLAVFAIMFIMKMSETELSNIRDIHGDTKAGNETFPIVHPLPIARRTVATGVFVSMIGIAIITQFTSISLTATVAGTIIALPVLSVTPDKARNTILVDRLTKIALAAIIVLHSFTLI